MVKTDFVKDCLYRIGKLENLPILDIEPSPEQFNYRNKVQFMVNDNLDVGLYEKATHNVVPIENCLIQTDLNNKALKVVKSLINKYKGKKLFKTLFCVYSRSSSGPNPENLLCFVVKFHNNLNDFKLLADEISSQIPENKGIVLSFKSDDSNFVLGKDDIILSGRDYIFERVGDLKFKVGVKSFFQVNNRQAQNIINFIKTNIPEKIDCAVDGYCGGGLFSLLLAKKCNEVIGFDNNKSAILDAEFNANSMVIKNVSFENIGTLEGISKLNKNLKKVDLILLDPPRKGCETEVLDKIAEMKIPNIIYISCNPSTFSRDLKFFSEKGYNVSFIKPFDMFPQTYHVEIVGGLRILK